ncbi:MAG: DUF6597 domain-containing transcriptional factor [Nocardioidaceae bacterium]
MTEGVAGRSGPVYVELRPTSELRGYVSTAWVRRAAPDAGPVLHRDIPDGRVDVRCRLGRPPQVVGPLTTPREWRLEPGAAVIGFRLRPGAAARLGLPVEELTDQLVDAQDVFSSSVARGVDASSPADGLAALSRLVLSGHRDGRGKDPIVDEAMRRMAGEKPWELSEIWASLDIPERTFRRRFRAAVGLGPKALQQLLRFQHLLGKAQRAAAAGEPVAARGLAAFAVEAGYADQSHLTRECVRITGLPPRGFFGDLQCSCRDHDHRAAYS